MKTKLEIREEIKLSEKTIQNHRKTYKEGKISREILRHAITENGAIITALEWVLGENERWD